MFWSAFVNVLAIIGIVVAASFVLIFICDLLLNVIDKKNGIFFKRKDTEDVVKKEDVNSYSAEKELAKLQELFRNKYAEGKIEDVKNTHVTDSFGDETVRNVRSNAVNDSRADDEERILRSKYEMPATEMVKPLSSKDISNEIYLTVDNISNEVLEKYDYIKTNMETLDDYAEKLNQYKIEDIKIDNLISEDDADEYEKDEIITTEINIAKNKIVAIEEKIEAAKEDNIITTSEAKMISEYEVAKTALMNEINRLKSELEAVNNKPVQKGTIYTSIDACEERLLLLEERLKVAKKELKTNDKEYKPLTRVRKNLVKFKDKLRRKELGVAGQKIALYGVNNYADIDKDNAEKLTNDIELYEGLRLSVQDCENVIDSTKDRYPILEQNNIILTNSIANIEMDIAEIREILAKLKAQ